jgi:hypothetical protein
MTNDKDSAVLDIVERLDLATSRLGGESKDDATVRRNKTIADAKAEILRLRQPTQSDALLTKMNEWCKAVAVQWGQGSQTHNIARDAVDIVRAALQEQSNG